MLGIVLNLPPVIDRYFASYSVPEIASHALLFLGWIPIFGVIIWGFTQVWVDYKQGQYFAHIHWVLLNISIPAGSINTPKGMENFFNNLAGSKSAITWKEAHLLGKFQAYFSFEIVGNEGDVKYYIRTPDKYRDLVEAALYAQYPEAQIVEVEDYVGKIPDKYPNDTHKVFGSEMKLAKPSYYPLRTWMSFEHLGEKDFRFKDPLLNVIEILGKMQKNEHFWIQFIIMQPDEQDWAKEGEKYLNKLMGKEEKHAAPGIVSQVGSAFASLPGEALKQMTGVELGGAGHDEKSPDDFRMFKLTPTERGVADAIAEKISKLGWYTKIRVLYTASHEHYRKPLVAAFIKGLFHPFAHLNMNKLSMHDPATPKDDYFWLEWQIHARMTRLVRRYKMRLLSAGAPPFVLNSEEMATLFHFPASDARTPILANTGARRAEAPNMLPFAPEDAPDMMTVHEEGAHGTRHDEDTHAADAAALSVPTPHMETAKGAPHHAHPEDGHTHELVPKPQPPKSEVRSSEFLPQPGRAAPLPPGMDLTPQPISDDDDAPPNLPVL